MMSYWWINTDHWFFLRKLWRKQSGKGRTDEKQRQQMLHYIVIILNKVSLKQIKFSYFHLDLLLSNKCSFMVVEMIENIQKDTLWK